MHEAFDNSMYYRNSLSNVTSKHYTLQDSDVMHVTCAYSLPLNT